MTGVLATLPWEVAVDFLETAFLAGTTLLTAVVFFALGAGVALDLATTFTGFWVAPFLEAVVLAVVSFLAAVVFFAATGF